MFRYYRILFTSIR